MTESAWADEADPSSQDFWESTRPAPFVTPPAGKSSGRQRRPAAALASGVNELLESMARKRIPRLDGVRERLQHARGVLQPGAMEDALHGLHAATTRLDFLAGRTGGDKGALFIVQGEALAQAVGRLQALATDFLAPQASGGPVARLLWIDLLLEADSLHKRVRQGARWLAEMDQDLVARRAGATGGVMTRAIEELARRAHGMHERLQTVHRLCVHARTVHKQCEQLASERRALCATLQDKVFPGAARLQEMLRPLLQAAAHRPLVATELIETMDARHELQVTLTQAVAQIIRLHAGDQELASQLAWMAEKASRLT